MRANSLFNNMINIGTQYDINGTIWEVINIDAYNEDMQLELLKYVDGELRKTGIIAMASDITVKQY